jgi:hypothetical protein
MRDGRDDSPQVPAVTIARIHPSCQVNILTPVGAPRRGGTPAVGSARGRCKGGPHPLHARNAALPIPESIETSETFWAARRGRFAPVYQKSRYMKHGRGVEIMGLFCCIILLQNRRHETTKSTGAMWELNMARRGDPWRKIGEFESVTAAASQIVEIEGQHPGTTIFFSILIETLSGVDGERRSTILNIRAATPVTATWSSAGCIEFSAVPTFSTDVRGRRASDLVQLQSWRLSVGSRRTTRRE